MAGLKTLIARLSCFRARRFPRAEPGPLQRVLGGRVMCLGEVFKVSQILVTAAGLFIDFQMLQGDNIDSYPI